MVEKEVVLFVLYDGYLVIVHTDHRRNSEIGVLQRVQKPPGDAERFRFKWRQDVPEFDRDIASADV